MIQKFRIDTSVLNFVEDKYCSLTMDSKNNGNFSINELDKN